MRNSCGQSWGAQQEPGKGRRGVQACVGWGLCDRYGGQAEHATPGGAGPRWRRAAHAASSSPQRAARAGSGLARGAPHLPVAGLGRGGEGQGTARPAGPPRLSLRPTPAGQSAFDPEQPKSRVPGPPSPPTAAASGTPSLLRRRARDVIASAPPLDLAPPPVRSSTLGPISPTARFSSAP